MGLKVTEERLTTGPVSSPTSIRPPWNKAKLALGFAAIDPGGQWLPHVPHPLPGEPIRLHATLDQVLGGLEPPNLAPVLALGHRTLSLAAAPGRYPFDWYALQGELSLEGVSEHGISLCRPYCSSYVPLRVSVFRGAGIAPFAFKMSILHLESPQEGNRIITMRFERANVTRWYIVIVALIPLVLGLLLCLVLFRPESELGTRIGPEAIAGVAAVLLAILPIRLVLVPTEISEPTLVDYWLGFEMALLAALGCLAVRRAMGVRERPPA
jgi:hypothetical protein